MLLEKLTRSNFLIKLKSWEYWPFGIVHFPVIVYWLWLSLRTRSLFFFSASNPGITMGGMFGESKFDVLQKIPKQYLPTTILIKIPATAEDILQKMKEAGLTLPVIFKPDLGERGFMVKRIASVQDIELYIKTTKAHFLIQELVDLPLEFGVFYARLPSERRGRVTSIVMKEMLTVTGNGCSSFEELILAKDRAKLQWKTLKETHQSRLADIIPMGVVVELVSIGNHCLGTKFLDGSHLINDKLSTTFDTVSQQIDGFYFGRFDLRCETLNDLYEGRIKIMELNGCGAEPAHIYHPGFSLVKAVGVLLRHWRTIFLIARENHKRGVSYSTFKNGMYYFRLFRSAVRPV